MTDFSESSLRAFYSLDLELDQEAASRIVAARDESESISEFEQKWKRRYENALEVDLGRFMHDERPFRVGIVMEQLQVCLRILFVWLLLLPLTVVSAVLAFVMLIGVNSAIASQKYDKALARYRVLAVLVEVYFGPGGDMRSLKYNLAGWVYFYRGDQEEAEDAFQDAIDWSLDASRRQDEFGKEALEYSPWLLVDSLCGMALLQARLGELEDAELHARDAMEVLSEQTDASGSNSALNWHVIGFVLYLTGHDDEAEECAQRARETASSAPKPDAETQSIVATSFEAVIASRPGEYSRVVEGDEGVVVPAFDLSPLKFRSQGWRVFPFAIPVAARAV